MIDHETVERIFDAAQIAEVVQDFISLKRRGANYMGVCPFHHEKRLRLRYRQPKVFTSVLVVEKAATLSILLWNTRA